MTQQAFYLQNHWLPDRPVSKGANAYHQAIVNASWHIDNIYGLWDLIKSKITKGQTLVDFGAGTGGSALYLLPNLPKNFQLLLVDNSASWLGKAYEIFKDHPNVVCLLLKSSDKYLLLDEAVGQKAIDHVICANTIHLIADIEKTLAGILRAMKPGGTFNFQSGNIERKRRKHGVLMIHNTVDQVHDIAIALIQKGKKYKKYQKDLDARIAREYAQRKFVFPDPRSIDFYKKILATVGFKHIRVFYKNIRVQYADWLTFLRVRRLQAGILPEIGGKEPTPEEEHDRDELITKASLQLFKKLETENPFADNKSFISEWVYVTTDR